MEKAKSCPAPLPLRWKPELREAAAGDEMVTNGNGWKSKLHAAGPAANVALDVTSLMKQLEQQVDKALRQHQQSLHRALQVCKQQEPTTPVQAEVCVGKFAYDQLEAEPNSPDASVPLERQEGFLHLSHAISPDFDGRMDRQEACSSHGKHLLKTKEARNAAAKVTFGIQDDCQEPADPEPSPPGSARPSANTKFAMSYEDYGDQQKAMALRRGSTDCELVAVKRDHLTLSEDSEGTATWHLVHSTQFQLFFCVLIMVNSGFFGVETEYLAVEGLEESPIGFAIINIGFSAAFLVEWLLRVYVDGKLFFTSEADWGWNYIDTLLVGLSAVEFFLQLIFGSGQGTSSLTLVRMVRSLRLVRIIRIIRVLRFFRSLRLLILAVISTTKSLIWAMLLLLTLMYMFAVLFTQAAHSQLVDATPSPNLEDLKDAWGSVPRSVFTLFKSITNGNSWEQVSKPLSDIHGVWLALFLIYIALTYFAVLNVVTGVFCQMAIEGAGKDEDELMQELLKMKDQYIHQLTSMFNVVDHNRSGKVSIQEFQGLLQDPDLVKFFATLQIDVEDAWSLFKLLDTSGDGEIDVDEFVTGCLKLRGQARSVDLALLQHQVKWLTQRFSRLCEYLEVVHGNAPSSTTSLVPVPSLPTKSPRSDDGMGKL